MSHLSTLDPVDDVARRAAPPAGGPGAGAGVPGDGDHDQLAGVHPDGVQGLHGPLLDKFAGRLHCDVAPVTPVRGLLVTSELVTLLVTMGEWRVERGGQGLPCPRSGVTEPEPESEGREVRCDTGARASRGQETRRRDLETIPQ